MLRPTRLLLRRCYSSSTAFPRLTLYTRVQCGLCDDAKAAVEEAHSQLPPEISYTSVDIMLPQNKDWFEVYAYDVPVIHFQTAADGPVRKIMHHIQVNDVIALVTSSMENESE
ncbi:uncharacterized protein V1518DRAFT_421740 [Limtongia smithiae]|uniref:uncharacterized protein n=1 Tax=Limtongia smithiae TaxID=1125753 RepID=UPI0034CDC2A0